MRASVCVCVFFFCLFAFLLVASYCCMCEVSPRMRLWSSRFRFCGCRGFSWRLDVIYTLLYSLAGPRRSNFGTGDRACDCYSVASSFELGSVVCVRFPANEALLHSFAFLAIGSCGCRESSSKVDMICTRTYSFSSQGDPISKQGIVCMFVICLRLHWSWLVLCM